MPTFEEAAATVIDIRAESWKPTSKTAQSWRSRLATYAFPIIGDKSVSEVQSSDVIEILRPVWHDKHEAGVKVLSYIGAIFAWAKVEGYCREDPADFDPTKVFGNVGAQSVPHRVLPYTDVSSALIRVGESGAWEVTKLALEFLILTAARSGEVRGAKWDEIDLDDQIWNVHAERMKGERQHRVPLSDRAMEILEQARPFKESSGLVFPSVRGKVMSDGTL